MFFCVFCPINLPAEITLRSPAPIFPQAIVLARLNPVGFQGLR